MIREKITLTLKVSLLIFIVILLVGCEDKTHYKYYSRSETNWGKDFIGVWESTTEPKIRFKIDKRIREGVEIEDRFSLSLISSTVSEDSTDFYIKTGQYNHHTVLTQKRSAQSSSNSHPFKEFIHSNGSMTVHGGLLTVYLGFRSENYIVQKIRTRPDMIFRRIIFKNKQ